MSKLKSLDLRSTSVGKPLSVELFAKNKQVACNHNRHPRETSWAQRIGLLSFLTAKKIPLFLKLNL